MWTRRQPDPPLPFDAAELARRLPVWRALADLFLDTAMDERDHASVADALRASGYTPAELDGILCDEVAPVFYGNLLVVAGQWGAWNPDFVREAMLTHVGAAARRPAAGWRRGWWPPRWWRAWRVRLVQDDWVAVRRLLQQAATRG